MGHSAVKGTLLVVKPNGKIVEVYEVTKVNAKESRNKTEYGHNLSGGAQDLVYGIWRMGGTIEIKIHGYQVPLRSGMIVYLFLLPWGINKRGYSGWAGIDSGTLDFTIEDGKPVSATFEFSSKGVAPPWAKKKSVQNAIATIIGRKGAHDAKGSGPWSWKKSNAGGGGGGGTSSGFGSSSGSWSGSGSGSGSAGGSGSGSGSAGGSGSGGSGGAAAPRSKRKPRKPATA